MLRHCTVLALSMVLTSCASNSLYQQWQPQLAEQASVDELAEVPFYAQKSYQCGPAALATVLSWAGEKVHPDALTEQLFIRDRKGSLQIEMQAATRRQGLVPYAQSGELNALLLQLEHGVPVVVLQNLALSWAPTWHYAVVVGFDATSDEFLLRSGSDPLRRTPSREFARTWAHSGQWMMTVHKPGEIPLAATPERYIEAVNGLERVRQYQAAHSSYQAAAARWPQSFLAWMALGNSHYGAERYGPAEQAYHRALQLDAQQPAAAHNLAWALMRQDKHRQALPFAQQAAQLSDQAHYRSALQALER